jgi:uncharacterized protein (DUF1697 family)
MVARKPSSHPHDALGSWVALLRGVNVGGHGRVPMPQLRELFESLGFEDVRTLIQSGNVIFRATSAPSAPALEAAVAERFQVTSPVVLRTSAQLAKVIDDDPFVGSERAHVHVGFMVRPVEHESIAALEVDQFAPERIAASGGEVYFLLPAGLGNSKLASYVARKLGNQMTVRNWNTVTKLVDLAST